MKWLEDQGHLRVIHSPGRASNRYRPILDTDTSVTVDSANPDTRVTPTLTPVSVNPDRALSDEPLKNLIRTSEGKKTSKREIEKGRKKPSTPLPDGWTPTVASIDKAKMLGFTDAVISRELEKFRNHARQTDRRCVNWDAAADNWFIKAAEFLKLSPPVTAAAVSYPALPGSPQWQAWRTHLRDTDSPQSRSLVRELDARELERRPFAFEAEWPPGFQIGAA